MESQACVKDQQSEVIDNLKWNIFVGIADGAVYSLGSGMVPLGTLLVYFAGNFTDSKVIIGLLTTLYNLMLFTPQVLLAKKVQTLKYYKPFGLWMAILQRIPWLLMGIFTLLFAKTNPTLYIVIFYILIAAAGMTGGFGGNVWLVLTARVIPDDRLSSYFSIRSSICGVLEITGAFLSGILLSYGSYPYNYGYLFIISFSILMVSYGFFASLKEPRNITKRPVKVDNQGYFKHLGKILKMDKNFLAYLSSTALVGGLGKMSLVFQIIYAKEKLSITAGQVALVSTVLFITQTCGYIMWGVVVKKKGLKLAGTISGILFLPAILLTLWMPNMAVLLIAVTFMSFAQSYRNSNENKLVINLAPNQDMLPSYVGLRNTLMGPFFSLNSLLAGFLLDMSNFTVLTIISFICMAAGMLIFAFKLKVPEA